MKTRVLAYNMLVQTLGACRVVRVIVVVLVGMLLAFSIQDIQHTLI